MLVEVQRSGAPVVVDDVDDAFVLLLAEEAEVKAREADRSKLRIATHWALRHVVADVAEAAHWSDADRRDVCEPIGGEGTPLVSAAAVEPLAVALSTSSRAALQLMSDGLDLAHRLPQTFRAVEELRLAPWRGRQIAQLTHRLGVEAAAHVDAKVAPIADTAGRVRIERLVDEAAARFDAVAQAEAEDAAAEAWGVRLEHYAGTVWTGTSRLEVIGDTPTLTKVFDLVNATARQLLDPDLPAEAQPPLEHRKVAALGSIADGAGASARTTLYLHLDAATLPDPVEPLGAVERLGPLTVATIRTWLGTGRFTLQPVLDLTRTDAVDQHDPPRWMRELVVLRDPQCVFPRCERSSRRCDLDHIEPYVEMDDGGPPGQTRPDNLAPLCRRHHRAKTHYGWSYQRDADGSCTWTDPYGRTHRTPRTGRATSRPGGDSRPGPPPRSGCARPAW